jgi:hypothetical protein
MRNNCVAKRDAKSAALRSFRYVKLGFRARKASSAQKETGRLAAPGLAILGF